MAIIDTKATNCGGGFCISNDASKCMQSSISSGGWKGKVSWAPPGATTVTMNWPNPTGQIIFVCMAQGGLNFGGTVCPGGIAPQGGDITNWTNDPGTAGMNYLRQVADLSFGLSRHSDGLPLVTFGYDHYDNYASNVRDPVTFPHPIPISATDSLDLYVGGGNGYFQIIGGSVQAGFNCCVWYTIGAP